MSNIYEPSGKAGEYSQLALNYYKGCTFGCQYCYVPQQLQKLKGYNHNKCELNSEIKKLETNIKKYANGNQIFLSFTSDPYNLINRKEKYTREVLLLLLKYNIPVRILTKGFYDDIIADLDVFKQFGENIAVGMTLCFDKYAIQKEHEKHSSSPDERIKILKTLKENGIRTWASIEPVIIPDESINIINRSLEYTDEYKIGMLSTISPNYKTISQNIDWYDFLEKVIEIMRTSKKSFYIKKELQSYDSKDVLTNEEKNAEKHHLRNNFTGYNIQIVNETVVQTKVEHKLKKIFKIDTPHKKKIL